MLFLFLVILWRGVRIALSVRETSHRMLALGITLLISVQGMINMAVVTGLLPTTGAPQRMPVLPDEGGLREEQTIRGQSFAAR